MIYFLKHPWSPLLVHPRSGSIGKLKLYHSAMPQWIQMLQINHMYIVYSDSKRKGCYWGRTVTNVERTCTIA